MGVRVSVSGVRLAVCGEYRKPLPANRTTKTAHRIPLPDNKERTHGRDEYQQ